MLKRLLLLALILLSLAACTGSGALEVTDVRANLTLPTDTGAVYLTITNNTAEEEALIGAEIPGCGAVELHEMVMTDGMMQMRAVEGGRIVIPAGETVRLEQGGLHMMCLGKTGAYTLGETITVTLEFAVAGKMPVDAEIVAPGE